MSLRALRVFRICVVAVALAGCASHGVAPLMVDPAAVARLDASVRLVGRETTWVTHGPGYELIARTKADLAIVQPLLNGEASAYRRVFPMDTLPEVVVTIGHTAPTTKTPLGPAPVPNTARGEVVEVLLSDPNVKLEDDKSGLAGVPGGLAAFDAIDRTLPVMRAWLSAHASSLTKTPASRSAADGRIGDGRIPDWAEAMVPLLAFDSLTDRFTLPLGQHLEIVHPLANFFAMERPGRSLATTDRPPGRDEGRQGQPGRGGGGTGGGRGGMGGGRGGAGGMGGTMGGRGGARGGGSGGRTNGDDEQPRLRGAALFDAQALVLGKFLATRNGYDFIGALVDSKILGRVSDASIAEREKLPLDQLDIEWRRWLGLRAAEIAGPVR